MKRRVSWKALLGLAILGLFAEAASAEMMARLQQFAQRDPLDAKPAPEASYQDGLNLHLCTQAAPVSTTDPSGQCSIRWRRVHLIWIFRWMSHAGLDVDLNGDGNPDFHVDYGGDATPQLCCRENGRYDKSEPIESWKGEGHTLVEEWQDQAGDCLCGCLDNNLPDQYGPCCNYILLGTPPYSNSNGALHAAIQWCEFVCGTQLDRPSWVDDWNLPGWDNIPEPHNGPPCP